MNSKNSQVEFKGYRNLRKKIDELTQKLEKVHDIQMKCKSGCDLCCMNYSIFPVEFYSILYELKAIKFNKNIVIQQFELNKDCVFLMNHTCTIYESRPVICRTHGLPLLFANEDGKWELSSCELNFTSFNYENFTGRNTFPQDKFNSKLFLLNQKYISEFTGSTYTEFDLIPLKDLINQL